MHEGSIAKSVLETSLKFLPHDGKTIKKISLAAGVLSGIDKECFETYFRELSKGTAAEGAGIEMKVNDASLVCSKCGHSGAFDGSYPVIIKCDKCGGENRLEGGEGVYIDSIEVEK